MTGSDASSPERPFGRVDLRVDFAERADSDAAALVERRVRAFADAVQAGYFFPADARASSESAVWASTSSVGASLEVRDLPSSAFAVLGGMLADCRHEDVALRSAHAVLSNEQLDLLVDPGLRPAAVERPPFAVDVPSALTENSALLVEIEFAEPVEAGARQRLLDDLALWSTLSLAYAVDPHEPVEAGGAQQLFNDPRTIHHHEWVWNNADPLAWDLLVNLCCRWSRTWPVVRLHVE